MLGAKRTHGRALGTKHANVDLLGAKMVVHDGKKPSSSVSEQKEKLENQKPRAAEGEIKRASVLSGRQSYLKFTINDPDANALAPDYTADSFIEALELYHGSNLLEQLRQYGALLCLIRDWQGNTNVSAIMEAQHATTARTGAVVAASGGSVTVCLPILSGIIGAMSPMYFPAYACSNGDLRQELTLASAVAGAVATTGVSAWTISNPELVLEYVELSAGAIAKLPKEMTYDFESFENVSATIASANEHTLLAEWQFEVGGKLMPPVPVRTTVETFSECLKAHHGLGVVDDLVNITKAQYELANAGATDAAFAIGLDTEYLTSGAGRAKSGVDVRGVDIFLEQRWASATSQAFRLDTFAMFDGTLHIKNDRLDGDRTRFRVSLDGDVAHEFLGKPVRMAVEWCDAVRWSEVSGDYSTISAGHGAALRLECMSATQGNTWQSWDGLASRTLCLLQNYLNSGVYGVCQDSGRVRRDTMGAITSGQILDAHGPMEFRLSHFVNGAVRPVAFGANVEPYSFSLVFWTPEERVPAGISAPLYRAWLSSADRTAGTVQDGFLPFRLTTSSNAISQSGGRWMAACDYWSPVRHDSASLSSGLTLELRGLVRTSTYIAEFLHLGRSYRTGEEQYFGQRLSIKGLSADTIGKDCVTDPDAIDGIRRQEKIRWYVNPLFEPEEGDAPCMVEHLSLPIKKPVVPTKSARVPTESADSGSQTPEPPGVPLSPDARAAAVDAAAGYVAMFPPDAPIAAERVAVRVFAETGLRTWWWSGRQPPPPPKAPKTKAPKTKAPPSKPLKEPKGPPPVNKQEWPQKCPDCDAVFNHSQAKHDHKRRSGCGMRSARPAPNKQEWPQPCPHCDAVFKHSQAKYRHKKSGICVKPKGPRPPKWPAPCPDCGVMLESRHQSYYHRNHPRYAAHLNEDLFGGLSTSGVPQEPVSRREFAHPLADIASVTELRPDASANDLSGRLILKRACGCCADADAWDFAGPSGQPLRGDVLSKAAPDAYVVEASAFSALSLW
eukprot:jgi/Tetstr1/454960/TSEL_041821.t1